MKITINLHFKNKFICCIQLNSEWANHMFKFRPVMSYDVILRGFLVYCLHRCLCSILFSVFTRFSNNPLVFHIDSESFTRLFSCQALKTSFSVFLLILTIFLLFFIFELSVNSSISIEKKNHPFQLIFYNFSKFLWNILA